MKSNNRTPYLISVISYIILVPGYFVYHISVGKGLIGSFLGGYSTIISAALIPFLGFAYYSHTRREKAARTPLDIFFLGYVLYYATVLLGAIAIQKNIGNAISQMGVIPQFVALFLTTRLLPHSSRTLKRLNLGFILIVSGVILLNSAEGSFVIATLDIRQDAETLASYQAYALMYTIALALTLGQLETVQARFPIHILALTTLFLNGARTEFIGAVLIALTIEFFKSKNKVSLILLATVFFLSTALLSTAVQDLLPNNRVLLLFTERSNDESASERGAVFQNGISTIANNPITGNFGSYPQGEYIHNALSAWVDLGLVGFVWYIGLVLTPVAVLLRLHGLAVFRSPSGTTAIALSGLLLLFAVAAKHHSYQLLPVMFGFFAQHVVSTQRQRHISKAKTAHFRANKNSATSQAMLY